MNPSKRVLILGIFFEICLAALWAYLILQLKTGGLRASTTTEDAISTISSTLGGVMGVLGAVVIFVYFVLRKKEREQG